MLTTCITRYHKLMCFQVISQTSLVRIFLITHCAFILFDKRMGFFVFSQIALVRKGPLTKFTRVRFFAFIFQIINCLKNLNHVFLKNTHFYLYEF